jgi:hypothetical protein
MPQQPRHHVIHIRIRDELRRKLEREAFKHHFSLNNEIRIRLEDSFTRGDALRTVDDAAMDMQVCWARFSARFLRLELEERLAEEIARGEDLTKIKTLAKLWLERRATEQRQPSGGGVS